MTNPVNAWLRDALGRYVEMRAGDKTDYSIDFGLLLGTDTVSTAVLTLDTHITLQGIATIGASQSTGLASQRVDFELIAASDAPSGRYACNLQITTPYPRTRNVPFSVVIP